MRCHCPGFSLNFHVGLSLSGRELRHGDGGLSSFGFRVVASSLGRSDRCVRFLLRFPFRVCTLQYREVSAGPVTFAVVFMSLIYTISSGSKGGLSLVLCRLSKLHFACCFVIDSFLQNFSRSGHLGFSRLGHVGMVILNFLSMSSSAGEYRHGDGCGSVCPVCQQCCCWVFLLLQYGLHCSYSSLNLSVCPWVPWA